MKWFRNKLKHGSRLALFALAVQFALSFGHFHWLAPTQAAPVISSGLPDSLAAAATNEPAARPSPAKDDNDQHPADDCAVCAVVAMAGAVLFATPPLLLLPQAVEFLYRATDAEFVHLKSAGAAFQPRAPPAS